MEYTREDAFLPSCLLWQESVNPVHVKVIKWFDYKFKCVVSFEIVTFLSKKIFAHSDFGHNFFFLNFGSNDEKLGGGGGA